MGAFYSFGAFWLYALPRILPNSLDASGSGFLDMRNEMLQDTCEFQLLSLVVKIINASKCSLKSLD
jgi:hypothetical protein